ncbi:MAG: isoprenylcysteine carboxylmethyltransferase family protein [Ignavibacteriales bacterium]|nr:isoprenylcysteine carboxylmethyltransferase family protein [Ignavibacteriales bacterium]
MDLGIIIIAVSAIWLGSEIVLSRVKRSLSTDARFDKSSLRILWMTIFISVNIGVVLSFQRVGYFGGGSPVFPIVGIVVIICGLLIRWIAIFSLRHQFTVDVAIMKDHRIVSEGIYRFVRHPAYAGSILSFLGLGLCFANVISIVVIFPPICAAFLYRIRVEEEALVDAFGDEYTRYCKSTKRLIPGVF